MTNRLAGTLSPYLRAHASNPVDWFPWGDEAFAEARRRDVPVMISIGYSTCHWCHVMARESFSDPRTAEAINAGFVAVKVDREEHPSVDAAFLAAASAFTRDLGWPLTVFTTPDGRAFHAGTYWPPVARGGIPAFGDVLAAVRSAWESRRDEVDASADGVVEALSAMAAAQPAGALPNQQALRAAAAKILAREDTVYGGFGGAPKFPVATVLRLLQHPLISERAAVDRALTAMAASELRDEDGGFFRYATMRDWTTPHYERMLTDNAQLMDVARISGRIDVVKGIAGFLLDVLRRPGGGFGAAQDSESQVAGERSEGGYYRHPLAQRRGLEAPAVDGKVLTGWNGLAIAALARAGAALGERTWVDAAAAAAQAVLRTNRSAAGELVRSSLDGTASDAVATEADAGLLATGLFELAVATGDVAWASEALRLLEAPIAEDPTLAAHGIVVAGDDSDADLPSGQSALAAAHLAAWRLGAGEEHRARAEEIVARGSGRALAQPFAYAALLRVAGELESPPRQIVVVTREPAGALAAAARRTDADVVAVVTPEQARSFAEAGFSLFEGRGAAEEVAYDCRAFVCRLPTSDPAALARQR